MTTQTQATSVTRRSRSRHRSSMPSAYSPRASAPGGIPTTTSCRPTWLRWCSSRASAATSSTAAPTAASAAGAGSSPTNRPTGRSSAGISASAGSSSPTPPRPARSRSRSPPTAPTAPTWSSPTGTSTGTATAGEHAGRGRLRLGSHPLRRSRRPVESSRVRSKIKAFEFEIFYRTDPGFTPSRTDAHREQVATGPVHVGRLDDPGPLSSW